MSTNVFVSVTNYAMTVQTITEPKPRPEKVFAFDICIQGESQVKTNIENKE